MLPGSPLLPRLPRRNRRAVELSWRLPWTFACILTAASSPTPARHAGADPEPTGPEPRRGHPRPLQRTTPARPDTTGTGCLCGDHLARSLSPAEIAGPAPTATQQRLLECFAADTTTLIGIPTITRQFLSDLAVIARHALRRRHPADRSNRRVTAPQAAEAFAIGLDILAATSLSDAAATRPPPTRPAMRSGLYAPPSPTHGIRRANNFNGPSSKPATTTFVPPTGSGPRPPAHGHGPPPPTTKQPTAATLLSRSSSGPAGHCGFSPTRDSTPNSTGQRWPSACYCRATPSASNKPANASEHRPPRANQCHPPPTRNRPSHRLRTRRAPQPGGTSRQLRVANRLSAAQTALRHPQGRPHHRERLAADL